MIFSLATVGNLKLKYQNEKFMILLFYPLCHSRESGNDRFCLLKTISGPGSRVKPGMTTGVIGFIVAQRINLFREFKSGKNL